MPRVYHLHCLTMLILGILFLLGAAQIAAQSGSPLSWGTHVGFATGTDNIRISAGFHSNLALKEDGRLIAWGANYSRLCDVPEYTVITDFAAGSSNCLALQADGSLLAWGETMYNMHLVPPGNDFIAIVVPETVSSHDPGLVPPPVSSLSVYPNPLARGGRLNFSLREVPDRDRLVSIHNLRGQIVASVQLSRGQTNADWNGKDASGSLCAAGVYLYRCQELGPQTAGKFLILK